MRRLGQRIASEPRLGALVVLLVGLAVFLPRLGADGLARTEGHRVIPGWETLDRLAAGAPAREALLVPVMFERPYLRKPQAMVWAEAASAAVFGKTEWSARLVGAASSIGLALAGFAFALRWFGPAAGLAGGLAVALAPWLWQSGRSAQIEPLLTLFAAVAALLTVDLLVRPRSGSALLRGLLLGAAMAGAALAKGPGAAPVFAGAIAGGLIAGPPGWRRLWPVALGALVAGVVVAVVWSATAIAVQEIGRAPVTESVGKFLWDPERRAQTAALPLAVLIASLPVSLALPQAWSRTEDRDGGAIARTLGWGAVISIVLYALAGVSNVRYTMPVIALLAPLVGWGVHNGRTAARGSLGWVYHRLVTRPSPLWLCALLVGSQVWIWGIEPARDGRSGRAAGLELGAALPAGAEVWADHLIEAVPETLWYAASAPRPGPPIRPVWGDVRPGANPPAGVFLALRTDVLSDEGRVWEQAGGFPGPVVHEGRVRLYRFVIVRVQ
ncbi:MAG: ArnT family glycosyltransferase [Phycisphaerales bacterium JB039]